MKKITAILLVFISCSMALAQNMEVQNMASYLRNKEYEKAKQSADAAAIHESTKNSAKMWMYRGDVYKAIFSDTSRKINVIDPQAPEKALDAYINCLTLDKGKDIYKEEVQGNLVRAVGETKKQIQDYKVEKKYEEAAKCYDLLEKAIPFDYTGSIKRQNVTADKVMYEKFELYKAAGNKEKTTEFANKLIAMNYKEPKLYQDMMKISMIDKDTAAALTYIEKGKQLFEDNMLLIGTEIDIYMARKKTSVLKERLNAAIEVAPDNEVLYAVLGQVHEKSGDMENAEKNYLKALEIKPDLETVNFKLGAFYFNQANDWNKKYNELPPKETVKAKEFEEKVKQNFEKAIPFLEKAYQMRAEEGYRVRLLQAHTKLGNTEAAAKYKK